MSAAMPSKEEIIIHEKLYNTLVITQIIRMIHEY